MWAVIVKQLRRLAVLNRLCGDSEDQEMRITTFCSIGILVFLAYPVSVAAADCTRSSGCKDCGYFPSSGEYECGTMERDGYCSCAAFINGSGCVMSGDCDYTGGGGTPACRDYGICQDNQNRVTPPQPGDRNELTSTASSSAAAPTGLQLEETTQEMVVREPPEEVEQPKSSRSDD